MTPERLAEIKARLAAATPGPWRVGADDLEVWANRDPAGWDAFMVATVRTRLNPDGMGNGDAALIAHAPTDLADLLAYVEALTAELVAASYPPEAAYQEGWTSGEYRGYNRGFTDGLANARAVPAERLQDEGEATAEHKLGCDLRDRHTGNCSVPLPALDAAKTEEVVDLVAALRASVEAAKRRRAALTEGAGQ